MKRDSLRWHLRPYSMLARRKTTVNHAFASAIALYDDYDDVVVEEALAALGQDPEGHLVCAYCDRNPAETWDHVYGLVKDQRYSGYGHTIGNLLPCCKQCNSSKGNKDWRTFLNRRISDAAERAAKVAQLERYFNRYLHATRLTQADIERLCPDEMRQLQAARDQIIKLLEQSDEIASTIRMKVKNHIRA